MRFNDSSSYILSKISNALNHIDKKELEKAIHLIDEANHIFVYGAGRSGVIGKSFAMRLVQMGLTAYFIGETVTPIVTNKDLVILISNTGNTRSTLLVAQICKNVNAKIVAVTNIKNSELCKFANLSFSLNISNENGNLAPLGTLFEAGTLIFCDSLVAELMVYRNENEETMRSRHAIWV